MDVAAMAAVVDVVDDVIVVADNDTIPPPLYVDVGVTVLEEGKTQEMAAVNKSLLSWVEHDAVVVDVVVAAVELAQFVPIAESISVQVFVLMEQH